MNKIKIKGLLKLRDRHIKNQIICKYPISNVMENIEKIFEEAAKDWMDDMLPTLANKQQIKKLKQILESKI